MTITKTTAIEAAGWLKEYGTPAAAAHQVGVQLTAVRPYGSRDLERVRTALNFCVSYDEGIQARRIACLLAIASDEQAVR